MASIYIEETVRKYNGRRHVYYCLAVKRNGRRKRKYIPGWKIPALMVFLEARKQKKGGRRRLDRPASGSVDNGFFPKPMRFILESAGYSIRGSKLRRGRRFMSKQAAAVRFGMLDRESRELVGSAGNLLGMDIEAHSLLKRRNRYGIRTSYQECLADVMEGNT